MSQESKVKVQLYRSVICTPKGHKTIVSSLGLRKLNQVVVLPDNPATRGVVAKVPHLLRIVED
jgi:large subunit ribosomal protein L30